MKTINNNSQSSLFVYLLLFTTIFSLIEISFFIQGSGLYLGDFNYIAKHIVIPLSVLPGIFFYLFAQVIVHVGFTIIVWAEARLIARIGSCSWKQTEKLGFYLWGIALFTTIVVNAHFFPNSKYAELINILLGTTISTLLLWLSLSLMMTATVVAFISAMVILWRRFHVKFLFFSIVLLIIAFIASFEIKIPVQDAATISKPNIIIIGIDSLRPDYTNYFGSSMETPTLDDFFDHAIVFGEAITPIARTYPSWMSLLTGRYPKLTGARYDLIEPAAVDMHDTLPEILQRHGYQTLYAMDDTRFSNINTNAGFDEIITPPVGLNDFLLGTFNDFPMSNLLVNTFVGKWLFPHSYANRPAFITYRPDTFLRLLQTTLTQNRHKPLFFAVHFCLPHTPYAWAEYRSLSKTHVIDDYKASLRAVDEQLRDFLVLLKRDGLLQHSIVVLVSDHGEAFELPGDRVTTLKAFIPGINNKHAAIPRFYPVSLPEEAVDESVGHGTDVLALSQNHSVLAFRFYGMNRQTAQLIPGVVTLMDIKPTLMSFLGLSLEKNNSGISLRDYMDGKKISVPSRHDIFIESDFSPQAIHSVHPETRQLLFEGIDFFHIDPVTTKLTVKKSMGELIISSKQYADIYDSWILGLYPMHEGVMMPILVDLRSGQWTNDLRIPFAKKSPALHMLTALKNFYGSEIRFVENS